MAPPKYYEAQSSGLGIFSTTKINRPSLPVIISFPSDWTAEKRLEWYNQNDFYSTSFLSDGDAKGDWQTKIDQEYKKSTLWKRGALFGPWRPEDGVSIEEATKFAPIIDSENGSITWKAVPANTVLGLDLGKSIPEYAGELSVVNYLKDPSNPKTKRADIPRSMITSDGTRQVDNLYPNISSTSIPSTGSFTPLTVIGTDPTGAPQDQIDSDFDSPLASIADAPSGDPRFPEATKAKTVERLEDQNRETVKNFLRDQYNISGLDEGTRDFDFKMDDKGRLTELGVFNIIDGQREQDAFLNIITSEGSADSVNASYTDFKIKTLQQGGTGTFSATGGWAVPGFPQTGISGAPSSGLAGDMAAGTSTPTGDPLAVPQLGMTGNLQQQALARRQPYQYAAALPSALPGGASSTMRDIYQTPLNLAQRGYDLAVATGGFQPQQIAGGLGGFGFKQYLGAQPNYIQDLQRGIQAIDQVRQKYITQGQSTQGFSLPELTIFENYIDKPEEELRLRQSLAALLPAQMRSAYASNLQNLYNTAQVRNPASVATRQFGFNTGFSPFGNINPMQIGGQAPTAQIPIGQSINMDTSTDNTAVTGTGVTKTTASDGSTITFAPTGDGVTSTATVSKTEPKSLGGTAREAYGDGYAMVQRDSNGQIIQVYQIEADGSKRIIRDAKTDVEGADKQKNIYTGKTVKDEDIKAPPITVPPISGAKPTPAPTPTKTSTPPTWKAGQPLSEQYLAFLQQGGESPTQVKELKETDMQTDDKSVPLVTPPNPLTPPKNITDKLKEIYDRDQMLRRFKNYDYQVGKDLTWDPSNQDQFNLYMNQRVRQELGKYEQAKALANAQYIGAGGANVPPLTAPLPIPNTNLPYGYNNYIGFGGAKPPIIAGNSAAVANNYNINKPTVLDLANAFNYTMLPR